jgi:hypothetical protein
MPNEWGVAAVGVAGAVIGGFVGGVTPQLVAWYLRPELMIDYQGGKDNVVTIENANSAEIWVRARVQNTGRLRAKECQAFLTSLHEVRADGSVFAVLEDSKPLAWTGRSAAPLDVPPGVEFYVDLLRLSKNYGGWGIFGLFKHQQDLQRYSGTYQFRLMISADNVSPRRCAINIEYKQDWHTLRAWQVSA